MQDFATRAEITELFRALLPDLPEHTVLEIAAAVFQTEEASSSDAVSEASGAGDAEASGDAAPAVLPGVLSREAFTRFIGPKGIVEKLAVTLC